MTRRRDHRFSTRRISTSYSPTPVTTVSKVRVRLAPFQVTPTRSAARRQSVQHPRRAILNRSHREVEVERDFGDGGVADLVHWDGNTIIRFEPVLDHQEPAASKNHDFDHLMSTRRERSVCTEGTKCDDTVRPCRRTGQTAPDDYLRNFLGSLRPSLEAKIEDFKKIGLDGKNTLDGFIQWQVSQREDWIFSQNLYLRLTALELGGLMLGIERLSDKGKS
ncbi:hypothetical protein DFH29DRAFT_996415 [Suillus ampliporus]|nr:hypothetical protein DFH29DRAFT_996415 [Suillus ampliporus]